MAEHRRSVGLDDRHINWIDNNAINFSKWVRQQIDAELDKAEA